MRGGLIIGAGIITGNVLGFARVALTAYLLGTHSRADALAVAVGPVDMINSALINTMVFAFVPMLTERSGAARAALFRKLSRFFGVLFGVLTAATLVGAPWLVQALAPGLDPAYYGTSVTILRILAFSAVAAGATAIHSALLYTYRRFAPSAFYQASLNAFTVVCAWTLWNLVGVYGFAIGYTAGAWAQLAVVWFCSRPHRGPATREADDAGWREFLSRPAFFVVYAIGLGLNIIFTRAYATHAGPGVAAALEYCMRGVGVPLAFLVSPMSNSLLPEIARLRSLGRLKDAFRLIDRTLALAALLAVGGCAFALAFRQPVIAIMFQRGSFTADSTRLVSAVFLGLGPSLIGWSLLELSSRSLFALDRPRLPVLTAMIPVTVNVAITLALHSTEPQMLGLGASVGVIAGFAALFACTHLRTAGSWVWSRILGLAVAESRATDANGGCRGPRAWRPDPTLFAVQVQHLKVESFGRQVRGCTGGKV